MHQVMAQCCQTKSYLQIQCWPRYTTLYGICRPQRVNTSALTCILVLMTSSGVLPNTDAAPAIAPKHPVSSLGTVLFLSSPRYMSFKDSTTKNLMAWFDPCFMMVAVRPWYVPRMPGTQWRNVIIGPPSMCSFGKYTWLIFLNIRETKIRSCHDSQTSLCQDYFFFSRILTKDMPWSVLCEFIVRAYHAHVTVTLYCNIMLWFTMILES